MPVVTPPVVVPVGPVMGVIAPPFMPPNLVVVGTPLPEIMAKAKKIKEIVATTLDFSWQAMDSMLQLMQNSPMPPFRALLAMMSVGANTPAPTSDAPRPEGVPENWVKGPTRGDGGTEWVNPDNSGDRVRVMPGNPNSSNPSQQEPYVRDVRNGNQWLDVNGDRIEGKSGRNSPDTHIPLRDYLYQPKK